MRIIPAIDLIDAHAVRLTKGDYGTKKIYNEDPVEVAKEFEDNGIRFLHLVDLDGAKEGRIINWKVLERIANQTSLTIDFGGGLRSDKDLDIAFNSGAAQVTGGSIAVKDRETFEGWLEAFGAEKIILGADAKDRKIAVSGWEEDSDIGLINFVGDFVDKGIRYVVCTDISKDGMLEGPAIDLYQEMMKEVPDMKLIASGGVSGMEDIEKLAETNVNGVIIGKAIYEGRIDLKELRKYVE